MAFPKFIQTLKAVSLDVLNNNFLAQNGIGLIYLQIFDPANMPMGTIDIPVWAQVTMNVC